MESKSVNIAQIQQGDVGLEGVKIIPKGAVKVDGYTIAYGEATGHHHTFVEEDIELYEKDGVLYVNAPSGGILKHQTHDEVKIGPGVWRYRPIFEKDHLQDITRRVID